MKTGKIFYGGRTGGVTADGSRGGPGQCQTSCLETSGSKETLPLDAVVKRNLATTGADYVLTDCHGLALG